MSQAPVAVDPAATRAVADRLTGVLVDVGDIAAACRSADAAGMLDGATAAATTLLREVGDELRLAGELLRAIADGAAAADGAAPFDRMAAQVDAAIEAATAYHALTTSLTDDVGATPTDAIDPDLADGHDHPLGHFGWLPLFDPDGPSADDVDQGQVGDCWLLSALGSVAAVDPAHLRAMITDHRDGTYTVHLADGDVTVDDQLPYRVNADGSVALLYAGGTIEPGMPIWPAIVEKAQAIAMGGGYDDVSGDRSSTAFEAFGLDTDSLDLNPRFRRDPSDASVAALVEQQLEIGLPVTASSGGIFGMGGGHAWAVVGIEERGDEIWVSVHNPWGSDGFTHDGGSIERFDGETGFAGDGHAQWVELGDERDGVVTMRIDVFTANFRRLDLVEAP